MSESTPFSLFIDLITFDKTIYSRELEIKKRYAAIDLLKKQKEQYALDMAYAKEALHDITKQVDAKELEMKTLESQEADRKERMDHVVNQKEYKSIKHELETIGVQQHALEDVLIVSWNQLEVAKKVYDQKATEYQNNIQQVDTQIAQHTKDVEQLEQELAEQKKIRSNKEDHVPKEWLDKYTMMRARTVDPVTAVVDGSCGSCFYQLTDQDMILINRNRLLQCKGCYRFLYNAALAQ